MLSIMIKGESAERSIVITSTMPGSSSWLKSGTQARASL